ncbi:MAG: acid phosphatase type 7 [Thermomicrobiales bacterium]|nr:acid phosphatase type 7 [Thermomicrobiales bacterium]
MHSNLPDVTPRSDRQFSHRLVWLLGLVVLLAPLAHLLGGAQARSADGPTLTLSQEQVEAGADLEIEGTGFAARSRGELTLMPDGTVLGRFRTSRDGSFRKRVQVPTEAAGDFTVVATAGDLTAEAPLRIVVEQVTPTESPPTATAEESRPTRSTSTEVQPRTAAAEPTDSAPSPTRTPKPKRQRTPPPTVEPTSDSEGGFAVAAEGTTLLPAADARVSQHDPSTNFGSSRMLRVDGGNDPTVMSYLRFAVPTPSGVGSVKLRIWVNSNTADGPGIRLAPNTWTESTITWNNHPAPTGEMVSDLGVLTAGSWAEFDVTSLVRNGGTYTFVVVPMSSDGADFASRDDPTTGYRPHLVLNASGSSGPAPNPTRTTTPVPIPTKPVPPTPPPSTGGSVLLTAGDIAGSGSGDEATAKILDRESGSILTLGDNVYGEGTAAQFSNYYVPTWGRHKARTYPAAGNHEYGTGGAAGYFDYFGDRATPRQPGCRSNCQGYYSFDLGSWHIVVLNAECDKVGGCGAGSPQEKWLRSDLAAHASGCQIVAFHHPRFSSDSVHGSEPAMQAFWQAANDYKVELALVGHSHTYERFAPMNAAGKADAKGVTQIVVGTGGRSHYAFGPTQSSSLVRNGDTYGVLKLVLSDGRYSFEFLPEAGKTFTDSGSGQCR